MHMNSLTPPAEMISRISSYCGVEASTTAVPEIHSEAADGELAGETLTMPEMSQEGGPLW